MINGKRVLLERGDFVFIQWGRITRVFMNLARRAFLTLHQQSFFEKHYLPLLPFGLVASQVYAVKSTFLSYIESVIASLNFRELNSTNYRVGVFLHPESFAALS
ncbi:DNA-binding transcriptional regulator ChbR [Klebsiella michiganensis]|nr:DNA-binding transcriptional regulator ChbR [Klebsiella michiganensis]